MVVKVVEVVGAKTCRTEGEESESASFGLRFRIPCMPSPVDKSYLRESCFALVFRSQSQNFPSQNLSFFFFSSPQAPSSQMLRFFAHIQTLPIRSSSPLGK